MKEDETLEEISALIHDQWIDWSKAISEELHETAHLLSGFIEAENKEEVAGLIEDADKKASDIQKKMIRWNRLWVPYEDLSEDMKEKDRKYARKILGKIKREEDTLDFLKRMLKQQVNDKSFPEQVFLELTKAHHDYGDDFMVNLFTDLGNDFLTIDMSKGILGYGGDYLSFVSKEGKGSVTIRLRNIVSMEIVPVKMEEKAYMKSSFPPRYGKVTLPEVDWENIRCPDCGELVVLDHENDYESVKVCPHCNSKAMLIKRIRE